MRAYAVEDKVFARRTTSVTIQQARDIAALLCDHFNSTGVTVKRSHPLACSSYSHAHMGKRKFIPATIRLEETAADWEVCHEVCHHICRTTDRGHGKVWADTYVKAVAVVISDWYAKVLRNEFIRTGVLT